MSLYMDVFTCPQGHKRAVHRQTRSQGKILQTYCTTCNKMYFVLANKPKQDGKRSDDTGEPRR